MKWLKNIVFLTLSRHNSKAMNILIVPWQAVDELVEGSASHKDAVLEQYNYGSSDYYQPLIDSYSDAQFTCPATTTAKAHAKAGDMLYRYLVRGVLFKI